VDDRRRRASVLSSSTCVGVFVLHVRCVSTCSIWLASTVWMIAVVVRRCCRPSRASALPSSTCVGVAVLHVCWRCRPPRASALPSSTCVGVAVLHVRRRCRPPRAWALPSSTCVGVAVLHVRRCMSNPVVPHGPSTGVCASSASRNSERPNYSVLKG
jgi:hypothetical protein